LKASRDRGTRFILFGLSTPAREVLQLSRLVKVFEIYGSEEQALASTGTAAAFTGNHDPITENR
jgi:anti-anti-sigma regulatory factor